MIGSGRTTSGRVKVLKTTQAKWDNILGKMKALVIGCGMIGGKISRDMARDGDFGVIHAHYQRLEFEVRGTLSAPAERTL